MKLNSFLESFKSFFSKDKISFYEKMINEFCIKKIEDIPENLLIIHDGNLKSVFFSSYQPPSTYGFTDEKGTFISIDLEHNPDVFLFFEPTTDEQINFIFSFESFFKQSLDFFNDRHISNQYYEYSQKNINSKEYRKAIEYYQASDFFHEFKKLMKLKVNVFFEDYLDHLKGIHVNNIYIDDSSQIFIESNNGAYKIGHEQCCCEEVWLEDIEGDLKNLIGQDILLAESVYGKNEESDIEWYFHKLGTIKGYIDLKYMAEYPSQYSTNINVAFIPILYWNKIKGSLVKIDEDINYMQILKKEKKYRHSFH